MGERMQPLWAAPRGWLHLAVSPVAGVPHRTATIANGRHAWPHPSAGVNPRGLQEGLRALAQGGTPARLLIIDDGWQHMGGFAAGRWGGAVPCIGCLGMSTLHLSPPFALALTKSPPIPSCLQSADIDPQYKADAEQGVLQRYLSTAPGELEHRLAVGRLLAGGWVAFSRSGRRMSRAPQHTFDQDCPRLPCLLVTSSDSLPLA